ncbi:MAG: nucleotidyltransferase family protein [Anaerolineales bacterium]|nr:nucleotidyltransferase family protein [Anaerolineales bacterium]
MKDKERVLSVLRTLKPEIRAKYRVRELGVFGSFARGQQTAQSDVDVLVDFEPDASLFDLLGLALFLEDQLGQRVDVVPRRALRAEIRDAVLQELSPV